MEVVCRRRGLLYLFELRHAAETAVKVEEAAVIAATEMGEPAGLVHDDIPAVSTNIGKQPDRTGIVADQHQGFIEEALQQGKGPRVTGGRDQVGITDQLP